MQPFKPAYSFYVVILLVAIVVSLLFNFFLQETKIPFSELYFPQPDKLPNWVEPGQMYEYQFGFKNNELRSATYSYQSTLELFNVFDVTEGIYHCVAKSRRKATLDWLLGNETENPFPLDSQLFLDKDVFVSNTEEFATFNWDRYHADMQYTNVGGRGKVHVILHNNEEFVYRITFDYIEGQVLLVTQEGASANVEANRIGLLPLRARIAINGTAGTVSINELQVIDSLPQLKGQGQFDVAVTDTLITLDSIIVYRDSPLEVRNADRIREYSINNQRLIARMNDIREAKQQYLYVVPDELDAASCNEACQIIASYIEDNPPSLPSVTYNPSQFNPIDLLAGITPSGDELAPSMHFAQNTTAAPARWQNYSFTINVQIQVQPHTFVIRVDDLFFLFDDSLVYIIDHPSGSIERRPSNLRVGPNQIRIDSTNGNAILKVNSFPIININRIIDFTQLEIISKQTFVALGDGLLRNTQPVCSTLATDDVCRRLFLVESERRPLRPQRIQSITDPLVITAGLGAAPLLGVQEIFGLVNESDPTLTDLLDYDIQIEPERVDTIIPSNQYSFTGPNARLTNETNYTYSFDMHFLEGAGITEVGFHEPGGEKRASFILDYDTDSAYLISREGFDDVHFETTFVNLTEDITQKVRFEQEGQLLTVRVQNRPIFSTNLSLHTGYYSIVTFNTYYELRNIGITFNDLQSRIQFTISEDPCQLRLTEQVTLEEGTTFLSDGESKTITSSFMPERSDFDFGKVSVSLDPHQEGQDQQIHFWVINNG